MDKRLHDILTDQEDNYMLPFYWQRGDHTETIPEEIARIAASGCRAFCVESRPHPDFVGERWWRDMDIILEEADKRGMKVWLLDDDRFPTGHAAGMIAKKHPELRQWVLTERHIDVVGKMEGASILVDPENEDKRLIGVYAYRRRLDDEEITEGEGIDLFACLNGRYLSWDIPEGAWRIFFYYQSRRGGRAEYIDMLNRDSVRVLIDAVYESHFARYGKYFGNTFAGFFSDEPCFGNGIFAEERFSHGLYEMRIGKPAMALPYHQTVRERMANALGFDPLPYFNLLWYEDNENGALQAKLRYHYMDTITAMYRENFTKQLADWCASHGVEYIGHIIEDMNCRLGCGAGHYFRALDCQHMSGIDVVLHQIMPGMEDFTHTASVSWGVTRGTFFHYVLAKLGASLAHLTPHMKKRAMCEVFGAYGYGEDSVMMKYLIDHLLVRGINHFVPHAFSSRFPDGDCPPHFGVKGIDPSYEAFSKLVTYTNKVSHLFLDSTHIASAAVFYHAEGEWTSRFQNAATMEPIAKTLYDAHIDFDIVSYDMLKAAKVENKKLKLSDESFECLVIPYADHLPEEILSCLERLQNEGLFVLFTEALPENIHFDGKLSKIETLLSTLTPHLTPDTVIEGYPKLRVYHAKREGKDLYLFFNEDINQAVDTEVTLSHGGDYVRLDLLNGITVSGKTNGQKLSLSLSPYQSEIVVFGDTVGYTEEISGEYTLDEGEALDVSFSLSLAECESLDTFVPVGRFDHFFNVTAPEQRPDFSGKMRYDFTFFAEKGKRTILDLGKIGQNAALVLNGEDLGVRIAPPYRYDVTNILKNGENTATVTVSNTLVRKAPDHFSRFLQIKPSGMLGGMKLYREM